MDVIISEFFKSLEIYEDIANGEKNKENIFSQIDGFLKEPNTVNALSIYESFFKCYWIGTQQDKNPFLEMVNKMKDYEAAGGRIIIKHRDHFIHSVYVFLMGLCIYVKNENMGKMFEEYIASTGYKDFYKTKNEEFFYRWGIASLSHDIGYPIEILYKQLSEYSAFLNSYVVNNDDFGMGLDLSKFEKFDGLSLFRLKEEFSIEFNKKYPNVDFKNFTSIMDIFSRDISSKLNLNYIEVKKDITNKLKDMNEGLYMDHGFFSGAIILKWYQHLLYITNWNPAYFIFSIVDISSAILLHNHYPMVISKKSYNTGKLKFTQHPIAFLLILCDELQEWGRETFSTNEIKIKKVDIKCFDKKMVLKYYSDDELLLNKCEKIKNIISFENILDIDIEIEKGGKNEKEDMCKF